METVSWKKAFIDTANVRETVPLTLLSGGLGFLNVVLLPSYASVAFWIGMMIGTLLFLRLWKIQRSRGIAYLITVTIFCYIAQSNGLIETFRAGVFG